MSGERLFLAEQWIRLFLLRDYFPHYPLVAFSVRRKFPEVAEKFGFKMFEIALRILAAELTRTSNRRVEETSKPHDWFEFRSAS